MGELCSLITQPGIIDCIRYTPFFKDDPAAFPTYDGETYTGPPLGGKVPVLERFYFENGGRDALLDKFDLSPKKIANFIDKII